MSYIVKEVDGNKGILETNTNTFIHYSKRSDKEFQITIRKLNLGGGFNGWTPQFFASNVIYK